MPKPSVHNWIAQLSRSELAEYLQASREAKRAKPCPHCTMNLIVNRAVQRARLKVKEGKEARHG